MKLDCYIFHYILYDKTRPRTTLLSLLRFAFVQPLTNNTALSENKKRIKLLAVPNLLITSAANRPHSPHSTSSYQKPTTFQLSTRPPNNYPPPFHIPIFSNPHRVRFYPGSHGWPRLRVSTVRHLDRPSRHALTPTAALTP